MEKNKIYQGDCLEVLKTFPDNSIDCVMTSPPYFNQRDYGVEGQLGLEKTPEEYVDKLCNIFDQVKRILRKDGTCWVNISDCYGGYQGKNNGYPDRKNEVADIPQIKRDTKTAKSLLCVPEMFLLEMVKRGWLIRNKIVWYKRNVMPSSASDRFTIDYEMLYFFTKSKNYFFKQQYEPIKTETIQRNKYGLIPKKRVGACGTDRVAGSFATKMPIENKQDLVGNPIYTGFNKRYKNKRDLLLETGMVRNGGKGSTLSNPEKWNELGRNKRCVWDIVTKPSKEKHFAMYPEKLCETPIESGCPLGGLVLDPFFGAGTTGIVALKQNKNFIGIELNEKYIELSKKRIQPYLEQRKLL